MKRNMQNIPNLTLRRMHIPKSLYTVHSVHMNILLIRLTTRLNLLRTTPHAILSTLRHLVIEAILLLEGGRGCRASGGRGAGLGGVFGSGGSSPPRSSTDPSGSGNEAHEVLGIVGDVICEAETDFLSVGEVAVELVGEGVVKAIA